MQVLTARITQDCTGEGLFITTHQPCLSALYPKGKCEILLFSAATLFQEDTTLKSLYEHQSKIGLILEGRKIVLTSKMERRIVQRSKQQT